MKVYSMPEKFMEDGSVPAKWRLYGMLNGFWINGLTVYAANKHFAAKLNCTERQVRGALEELEKDGLVRRDIRGHNRTIYPGGSVSSAEEEAPVPPPRKPEFHPMHSINAPSLTERAKPRFEVVSDKKENKTTPQMKEVFALFKENPARQLWKVRVVEREAAAILHEEFGIEELRTRYAVARKYRNDAMCPQINTPSEFLEKMPKMENFLANLDK